MTADSPLAYSDGVSAKTILDPGLPHGRLWVVEKGCECGECEARRFADRVHVEADVRAAESAKLADERVARGLPRRLPAPWLHKVRFKRPRGRGWCVIGPPELVVKGTIMVTNGQGRASQVFVHSVGAVFEIDGVAQRYGYIRR